jgi:hypothetical protein
MKKLFVRYFHYKNDQVPQDSHLVCVDNCGSREMQEAIKETAYNASVWMKTYPDGKVDYVWL